MASAPPEFDAVMERALAVGVLSTPAYDRLTDEIARGDRTELAIAEEWAQALREFDAMWVIPRRIIDLSSDELAHILVYLTLAHDIARTALSCRAFRDAARLAFLARPYDGEIVTLGHTWVDADDRHLHAEGQDGPNALAVTPEGIVISCEERAVPRAGVRRVHGRDCAICGGSRVSG